MFGRRTGEAGAGRPKAPAPKPRQPAPSAAPRGAQVQSDAPPAPSPAREAPPPPMEEAFAAPKVRSEDYYDVKTTVFNALIDTIDLTQLAKLDPAAAR